MVRKVLNVPDSGVIERGRREQLFWASLRQPEIQRPPRNRAQAPNRFHKANFNDKANSEGRYLSEQDRRRVNRLIDQLSRAKEETVHLCNTLKKEREQMSRSNQDSEEAQKSLEIEVADMKKRLHRRLTKHGKRLDDVELSTNNLAQQVADIQICMTKMQKQCNNLVGINELKLIDKRQSFNCEEEAETVQSVHSSHTPPMPHPTNFAHLVDAILDDEQSLTNFDHSIAVTETSARTSPGPLRTTMLSDSDPPKPSHSQLLKRKSGIINKDVPKAISKSTQVSLGTASNSPSKSKQTNDQNRCESVIRSYRSLPKTSSSSLLSRRAVDELSENDYPRSVSPSDVDCKSVLDMADLAIIQDLNRKK